MSWGGWSFLSGKDLKTVIEDSHKEPIITPPMDFVLSNTVFYKPKSINVDNISEMGVEFIKKEEGFRGKAYLDSVGVWTIGYGTIKVDGQKVKSGDVCSKAEAHVWLMEEIDHQCVPWINKLVKVPLTQEMFDVLCSFVYNLGWPALQRSTLLTMLNSGDYRGAGDQILRWNKGKVDGEFVVIDGLDKRRRREREIFVASIANINANIG